MSDYKEDMVDVNFWEETVSKLGECGFAWSDVEKVIVTGAFEIDKDDFMSVAKRLNYNAWYGTLAIDPRLKIVGHDWWLERAEYDGKEWWEFKTIPNTELPQGNMSDLEFPYEEHVVMLKEPSIRWMECIKE